MRVGRAASTSRSAVRVKVLTVDSQWFEHLVGFPERNYHETQDRLEVVGDSLRSRVNGRVVRIGTLETPTLAELRQRASAAAVAVPGQLSVSSVIADVGALHRRPDLRHALFQVASQFNLLEMASPDITPEDGVTRYAFDSTQGPACALAAPGATIYRNYCLPVAGAFGQTATRQVDCLADLGRALGNTDGRLWEMRNGYALCSAEGLTAIAHRLGSLDATSRTALGGHLRIGLQWDVEVAGGDGEHVVSQAFCAALPVAYGAPPPDAWAPFARLILEAAYEATLCAATINARQTGVRTVLLTRLGGGAFGNDQEWIDQSLAAALARFADVGLTVLLVTRDAPSDAP